MYYPGIGILSIYRSSSSQLKWKLLIAFLLLLGRGEVYAWEGRNIKPCNFRASEQESELYRYGSLLIIEENSNSPARPPSEKEKAFGAKRQISTPPYRNWWAYGLGLFLFASNILLFHLWCSARKKLWRLKESDKPNKLIVGNSSTKFVKAKVVTSLLRTEAFSLCKEEKTTQEYQEFLEQLVLVFEGNLSNTNLTAKKLSQLLFMSYPTCLRKVKAATGMTIKECLRFIRIHRAAQYLKIKPKQSLTGIAWDVGYSSNTHFTRDFKKIMGCTPSEFRKQEVEAVEINPYQLWLKR